MLPHFLVKHGLVCRKYSAQASSNILKLHERGIFQQVFPKEKTPDLYKQLVSAPQCVYCGFDPTADSLHIGNLLCLIALLHCQRGGHQPIVLLGGATAQIGDPSGRNTERSRMEISVIENNVQMLHDSIKEIFTNHEKFIWKHEKNLKSVEILDNAEWYSRRNVVEFLSSMGRQFRMGTLLRRTSVQSRLQSEHGMSLTEFMYPVFQAYDWLHLNRNYNCNIQIGGSDQMGNMVAGHELVSRLSQREVYGLTVPLVTTDTGDKLGKTAGNAVWLSVERTSPFELYQYYIRLHDNEVEQHLKLFTFLSEAEISEIMKEHKAHPEARKAQRKVAETVTLLVHGEEGLKLAKKCTAVLYNKSTSTLLEMSEAELRDLFRNAQTTELHLEPGTTILDTVLAAKCFSREVDALRVIAAGGVHINHQRVQNPEYVLIAGQHILPNNITLIRVGKKNYYLVKWH